MEAMILKNCNIFKKEDNKEMEQHRRQSDNNSHESLVEENVVANRPSGFTNEQLILLLLSLASLGS
jgi:hypothetical protein